MTKNKKQKTIQHSEHAVLKDVHKFYEMMKKKHGTKIMFNIITERNILHLPLGLTSSETIGLLELARNNWRSGSRSDLGIDHFVQALEKRPDLASRIQHIFS